ncbi:MAG: hypothetical protein FWG24_07180 [Eggerthellaceae bacterium]|nr:hypothetical protein [Eggerthellaceae bacterium]
MSAMRTSFVSVKSRGKGAPSGEASLPSSDSPSVPDSQVLDALRAASRAASANEGAANKTYHSIATPVPKSPQAPSSIIEALEAGTFPLADALGVEPSAASGDLSEEIINAILEVTAAKGADLSDEEILAIIDALSAPTTPSIFGNVAAPVVAAPAPVVAMPAAPIIVPAPPTVPVVAAGAAAPAFPVAAPAVAEAAPLPAPATPAAVASAEQAPEATTTATTEAAEQAPATTEAAEQIPAKPRRGKKIAIFLGVLLLAILLVNGALIVYSFLSANAAPKSATNSNSVDLIRSQLASNHGSTIKDVGYDSALTFETYGTHLTSVDASTLKPLVNNYLATVTIDGETQVLLVDETAVSRILAANSDWSAYLQNGNAAVFENIVTDSEAQRFMMMYQGYEITYHRLAIGEIYTNGADVYVLVQPYYTITQNGNSASVNDVFLYRLVEQDDTLLISEIEQVKVPDTEEADS